MSRQAEAEKCTRSAGTPKAAAAPPPPPPPAASLVDRESCLASTVQYRRQTHLGELSELVRQRCGGATTASVADVGESTQGGDGVQMRRRDGGRGTNLGGESGNVLAPKRQRSVLLLACLPVCLFVPIVEARGRWVHEQVAERSEATGSPNSGRRVRFDWWLERD